MANTTADKLALLQATKANLKAALAEKGQTVGDVFSTYPAAVRAIETGGGTATVSLSLTGANFTGYVLDSSGGYNAIESSQNVFSNVPVPCILCALWQYGPPKDVWSISGDAQLLTAGGSLESSLSYTNLCFFQILVSGDCSITA